MFQNQHLSNHINHIHERAQGIAYQDHNLTFHDQKKVPSKFMTVICRKYLLIQLKLK